MSVQPDWTKAMRRGDFATAWAISDAVLAARDPALRDDPRLPYHLRWVWDGRDYRGQDVLIRCYHGLGDTIQFARCLPVLRPLVASLTVEVQPLLLPLLETIPGPDRWLPFRLDAPLRPSACDIEIMELPHALHRTPQELPSPPYLHLDPAPVPRGGIGLCWQGGNWDTQRAVPEELIGRILASACRRRMVFTLQPSPTTLPVDNPAGVSARVEQTAALIAGLDLVITVDTLVAHLAGALNRPTWLMLKHDADWRWMADRSDSPWYPSMRLYRQSEPGKWSEVIERISRDLRAAD